MRTAVSWGSQDSGTGVGTGREHVEPAGTALTLKRQGPRGGRQDEQYRANIAASLGAHPVLARDQVTVARSGVSATRKQSGGFDKGRRLIRLKPYRKFAQTVGTAAVDLGDRWLGRWRLRSAGLDVQYPESVGESLDQGSEHCLAFFGRTE